MPVVVNHVTGRGSAFSRPGLRSWIGRRVLAIFYRFALSRPNSATIFENPLDRAYFLSQGLADEARAWLIEGPGIDVNYFSPVPEPAGPITIGFLAGLQWDNGVGTFVEAARTLRKNMEARFVLVESRDSGNPAAVSRALLDQWLEEGVVEWWGAPTMEKKSLYGRCHVIAFPTSCDDAVPTVLLEAAASGRPVVASSVPGCQNVVLQGETGLLVPPGDARELAAALGASYRIASCEEGWERRDDGWWWTALRNRKSTPRLSMYTGTCSGWVRRAETPDRKGFFAAAGSQDDRPFRNERKSSLLPTKVVSRPAPSRTPWEPEPATFLAGDYPGGTRRASIE